MGFNLAFAFNSTDLKPMPIGTLIPISYTDKAVHSSHHLQLNSYH